MRADIKTVTILGLIVVVGLLLVSTLYFAKEYSDQKDKTATAKKAALFTPLSAKSKRKDVEKVFNERVKFPDKNDTTVVWVLQGQMVDEDDLFLTYGIVKPKQKETARTALFKGGAKRFVRSCNQLYGPKDAWSLGYCTLESFPKEQTA